MSMVQQLKKIEAERNELAEANKELEAKVAEMTEAASDHDQLIENAQELHNVAIEGLKEQHATEIAALNETVAAGAAALVESQQALEAVTADRDEIKSKWELSAEHDLADTPGGEPVADGAEGDGEEVQAESLWDQYNAIENPRLRTRFWKANEQAINDEMAAANG